jgi:dihydroorotase/N-acyl-D-amino-acid deacylase
MNRYASAVGSLAIGALCVALSGAQTGFDLVIRGGDVFDGSGTPARRADVGIRGDSIAQIGDLAAADAARTVDARGLAVAPGFIDMHSHSDYTLLVDGRALSKVTQGVTTELLGEADSAAPAAGPLRADREKALADLELTLDWTSLEEYFARVERQKVSVNIVSTVASGTVRAAVVGFEDRPATSDELRKMEELVADAMQDGAAGLSSGLIYPPNSYASTEELIALSKVAARYGGIYVSHIRNEGPGLLQALEEAIRIGREAAIQVEVLHFKRTAVSTNATAERGTIREAAALLEEARNDGVPIFADVYPYAASSTTLSTRIPSWALEGGTERLLARLRESTSRRKMLAEIESRLSGGIAGDTPGTILLSRTPYEPHRHFQGKRINEIADEMRTSPADAILQLVEKAEGRAGAIFFGMRDPDVEFALTRPWTTIGSDGAALSPDGILARSSPHPRSYGTFPRVLGHYVRERKSLSLAEAIRKMTSLPAARLTLRDRGTLASGMKADVVVFDPATISDRATFDAPHQLSTGVRWVVVNGEVVLAEGRHTNAKSGRVLRRQ